LKNEHVDEIDAEELIQLVDLEEEGLCVTPAFYNNKFFVELVVH
jgi:hypothetical protein